LTGKFFMRHVNLETVVCFLHTDTHFAII